MTELDKATRNLAKAADVAKRASGKAVESAEKLLVDTKKARRGPRL